MNVDNHMAEGSVATGGIDHFAMLGIERRYAIDKSELEARYLDRSKETHPDRFVGAEAAERVTALSASMAVNEAYKVLKSDRSRAEHLLALYGVVIGDSEKLDPSFLMSILEAREELAEAQARNDQAEIGRLEDAMLDRREAALERVATLFGEVEGGGDGESGSRFAEIKRELIILRYVDRYLEAVDDEMD